VIPFLLIRSQIRLVHDRIKNYLQKYLPAAQETWTPKWRQRVSSPARRIQETEREILSHD
jgi:hypothetical protein